MHFTALSKTLWHSQNRCTTAWRNKKKGVKRGAKAFWGGQTWRTEKLAMAERSYVKGEHMVMVWCTGTRCERQGKKKSDGQQKRKKGRNDKKKKTICPAKNPEKKKTKQVITMVLGEIDPALLWRKI